MDYNNGVLIMNFLYKVIFIISVFFKNLLLFGSKKKNVFLYLLLPPLIIGMLYLILFLYEYNTDILYIINAYVAYMVLIIIYFIVNSLYKSYGMWNAIKENEIKIAKVNKLYTEKRMTRKNNIDNIIYYLNMMDYEYNIELKKYKFTDVALLKLNKDNESLWKFDKEATKRKLTEEELKENYLSEVEIFIWSKNPKIHVFKNYNLHIIYKKATELKEN